MTTAAPNPHPAHERLRRYEGLVYKTLAVRFGKLPEHVDPEDLISAGLMGLWQAALRYDPGRGTQFRSFAIHYIAGAMHNHLRDDDWVPRHTRDQLESLGLEPHRLVPIDTLGPDGETILAEAIPDPSPTPEERLMEAEEERERQERRERVRAAIDRLNPYLAQAIRLTDLDGGTNDDLAAAAHICRHTAINRKKAARTELRALLAAQGDAP